MELIDCKVSENCSNICTVLCNECNDYENYYPIKPSILSPRQIRVRAEKKEAKKLLKNSEASKRGKRSKRKGYRTEKKVAQILGGDRVPLSGALGGKLSNDVIVPMTDGNDLKVEVKARADSWKELRRWLDDEREKPDCVVLVPDREEPIICFRVEKFKQLFCK